MRSFVVRSKDCVDLNTNFSLRFPGDYKRKDGIRIQFDQNLVFVMIFKSSMNKIAIYIKIRIIKCVYNLPGL